MLNSLKDYLRAIAICFLGMVAVCIALHPSIFRYYGYGISEFGAVHATVIPFFVGFAATVYFLTRIGLSLRKASRFLGTAFLVLAACLSGIAITSYPVNRFIYDLHWWFAGALVLTILVTMIWQLRSGESKILDYVLAMLFLFVTVMSGLPHITSTPIFGDFLLREMVAFAAAFWFIVRVVVTHTASIDNSY